VVDRKYKIGRGESVDVGGITIWWEQIKSEASAAAVDLCVLTEGSARNYQWKVLVRNGNDARRRLVLRDAQLCNTINQCGADALFPLGEQILEKGEQKYYQGWAESLCGQVHYARVTVNVSQLEPSCPPGKVPCGQGCMETDWICCPGEAHTCPPGTTCTATGCQQPVDTSQPSDNVGMSHPGGHGGVNQAGDLRALSPTGDADWKKRLSHAGVDAYTRRYMRSDGYWTADVQLVNNNDYPVTVVFRDSLFKCEDGSTHPLLTNKQIRVAARDRKSVDNSLLTPCPQYNPLKTGFRLDIEWENPQQAAASQPSDPSSQEEQQGSQSMTPEERAEAERRAEYERRRQAEEQRRQQQEARRRRQEEEERRRREEEEERRRKEEEARVARELMKAQIYQDAATTGDLMGGLGSDAAKQSSADLQHIVETVDLELDPDVTRANAERDDLLDQLDVVELDDLGSEAAGGDPGAADLVQQLDPDSERETIDTGVDLGFLDEEDEEIEEIEEKEKHDEE